MRRSLCDVVYCLLWFVVGWSLSLFVVGVVVSLLMRVVGCCSLGVLCCLVSCLLFGSLFVVRCLLCVVCCFLFVVDLLFWCCFVGCALLFVVACCLLTLLGGGVRRCGGVLVIGVICWLLFVVCCALLCVVYC